jgi:hypothetical protein
MRLKAPLKMHKAGKNISNTHAVRSSTPIPTSTHNNCFIFNHKLVKMPVSREKIEIEGLGQITTHHIKENKNPAPKNR